MLIDNAAKLAKTNKLHKFGTLLLLLILSVFSHIIIKKIEKLFLFP